MLKNLIITNIPKTEEAIKNTLHLVGEHSWSEQTIDEWLEDSRVNTIYYSGTYHCYMYSSYNKTPINKERTKLTYEELLKCSI